MHLLAAVSRFGSGANTASRPFDGQHPRSKRCAALLHYLRMNCMQADERVPRYDEQCRRLDLAIINLQTDKLLSNLDDMEKAPRQWVVGGVRGLRKKTEGPGEMVSAFQDRHRGFGFRVSETELRDFNKWRVGNGKSELTSTPGIRFCVMVAHSTRRAGGIGINSRCSCKT